METSSTADPGVILRCTQFIPSSRTVPGVLSQQTPRSVASITHAPRGLETLLQWSSATPDNATTITLSFDTLDRDRCLSNLTQSGDGCKCLIPGRVTVVR